MKVYITDLETESIQVSPPYLWDLCDPNISLKAWIQVNVSPAVCGAIPLETREVLLPSPSRTEAESDRYEPPLSSDSALELKMCDFWVHAENRSNILLLYGAFGGPGKL